MNTNVVGLLEQERNRLQAELDKVEQALKILSGNGVAPVVKRSPVKKGPRGQKREKLLAAASATPQSAAELSRLAGVQQAAIPLKKLVEDGLLKKTGKNKAARYTLA